MAEHSYQEAVQVLQNRMSGRWDGLEVDGREEMVRILKEDLDYDTSRADDVIDAMIESGTLRYHGATTPVALPAAPVGTSGSEIGRAPIPVVPGAGYWQIGDGASEATGRKGQVDPT